MSRSSSFQWLTLGAAVAVWSLAAGGLGIADDRHDLALATDQCKKASEKQAVIASCSTVIVLSRDPRLLERAYNRRGMASEATGQFDGAASDYSQVIRLDPKVAGYFDNRMRAYKALGRLDLALKDADTAVAMAPTYAFVFHGRGAVHYDRGEYSLAVEDYTAALTINRVDAALLVDRGRALVKLGQPRDAIRDFSEAHAVDAGFMPALRERGLASVQIGDTDQARADLIPVVAATPGDGESAAALQSLTLGDTTDTATPDTLQRVAEDGAPSSTVERAEAEARRQLQDRRDADAAREKAAQRLKAERLVRAKTEAQKVRGEASDFVKANRDDPQLLDHLQRIADLGAALPGADAGPIERGTALLSAGLTADPVYSAYTERHKAERTREDERSLSDAVTTLRVQKSFLIGEVVTNPTGDEASKFLSLAKQADAVLVAPSLARAQTVMGAIDAAISEAQMTDRYALARQAAETEAGQAAAVKPPP